MKPKIQDVAKTAGVSPTTVSRVLNDRGYISKETKEKVYQAMKEINYIPNDLARSLYNKRTHLIGVIVPSASNPFYGDLVTHIERCCNDKGYKVLLCNSVHEAEKEKKYWEMLLRNQVDGVIVVTYNRGLIDLKQHLPAVAIDHYLSKQIQVVSSDNFQGGKLATEELIAQGCKHIAHINGAATIETPANDRRFAYQQVMINNGLTPIIYEVHDNQLEVIQQLFAEHPEVDGIFASDDILAIKSWQYAIKQGYRIPEDLKIIGYDGTELIRSIYPELATIIQPIAQIAEKSVELLDRQINEQEYAIAPAILPVSLCKGSVLD
ncbi:LacI family DNA-binding transcriptional regulator [Gracilibacillus alcaliphilus]|uniref:LacI family DNA-binding transcriptional regulator n=1 Tax=Gracilibacillus alcaliphilus TaxID=1401441 RepID=UPI0019581526|nr:LacI family DNA-binding transcriptional regulator [Gracilibacillus alcaliphilus]MBM7677818.1 LacI family sucrose operon transcriptional repressor [Gracilibacillus alcaliphilus]